MTENPRKVDDGTAGPRPHGLRHGEPFEDIATRASFLKDARAKVVAAPEPKKPRASVTTAKTK